MNTPSTIRIDIADRQARPLTERVREDLEARILRGEIGSGARLNETHLAEMLGVSRGPIREAVRLLERDGLVATVAGQGAYVRRLSIEDALELYDLRAVIAGYACGCLARRAGAAEKQELRDHVEQMDACIRSGAEDAYFELNISFHDRITALSGGRRANELYTSLGKEVRLLRRRVLRGEAAMQVSNEEHKRILAAIEDGDGAKAREAAEFHHANGKRRWLETL